MAVVATILCIAGTVKFLQYQWLVINQQPTEKHDVEPEELSWDVYTVLYLYGFSAMLFTNLTLFGLWPPILIGVS